MKMASARSAISKDASSAVLATRTSACSVAMGSPLMQMGSVIVLLQDKNQTRVEHVSYAMLMAVPAALKVIPTLA